MCPSSGHRFFDCLSQQTCTAAPAPAFSKKWLPLVEKFIIFGGVIQVVLRERSKICANGHSLPKFFQKTGMLLCILLNLPSVLTPPQWRAFSFWYRLWVAAGKRMAGWFRAKHSSHSRSAAKNTGTASDSMLSRFPCVSDCKSLLTVKSHIYLVLVTIFEVSSLWIRVKGSLEQSQCEKS